MQERSSSKHRQEARHTDMRLDPQLVEAATDALAGEPVVAAYIHGSFARGQADEESDIDIALLTGPTLPHTASRDVRLRVTEKLLRRLSNREPDVVMLRESPVLLQYNVIRNGVVVLGRETPERRAFELDVERRYDDERPRLDRETDMILDRILSLGA